VVERPMVPVKRAEVVAQVRMSAGVAVVGPGELRAEGMFVGGGDGDWGYDR